MGGVAVSSTVLWCEDRTAFAFLINTRPASTKPFYNDFNGQLLNTGRQITNWPTHDLFPQFQTSFAVVHGASFVAKALAPDEFATILGANLSDSTELASTTPWPAELANTTVTILDSSGAALAAPLNYVSPQQIDFLVPSQAQPGPAMITVSGSIGGSLSAHLWVYPAS